MRRTAEIGSFAAAHYRRMRVAALGGLIGLVGFIAAGEHTANGQIATMLALAGIVSLPLLASRYVATTAAGLSAVLIVLLLAQRLKRVFLLGSVSLFDFMSVGSLGAGDSAGLLGQYLPQITREIGVLVLALLWPVLVLAIERAAIARVSVPVMSRQARASLALVALVPPLLYPVSPYVAAVAAAVDPYTQAYRDPRPSLRASQFVADLASLRQIRAVAASSATKGQPRPAPSACDSCPDIVVVHVESTFDPALTKDVPGDGLLAAFERQRPGLGGPLQVHTWGGGSNISEFELLCGIQHRYFGALGSAPNLTLAPLLRNCFPERLKDLGYETYTVYPARRSYQNMALALRRYGIDTVYDADDLGLSPKESWSARDHVFLDKAREILTRPRRAPRFIFVSTVWNHGPHNRFDASRLYPGPFDAAAVEGAAMKDYVNRLNDTFTTLAQFEQAASASAHPIAILHYGDHHPQLKMAYKTDAVARFAEMSRFITYYRLVHNRMTIAPNSAPLLGRPVLKINDLSQLLFETLGLPASAPMREVWRLEQACRSGGCTSAEQTRLIAQILARE